MHLQENDLDVIGRVKSGSFMPAILAHQQGLLSISEPLESDSGLTLLHYACFYSNVKAIRYILSKCEPESLRKLLLTKDNISLNEHCENTPLHSAVIGGELRGVFALLSHEFKDDPLLV